MDRRDEYLNYLKSDDWLMLRKTALMKAGYCCERCGVSAENVHHLRYPKIFKDDCLDNLIVLCRKCHKREHGIRGERMADKECKDLVLPAFPGDKGTHEIRGKYHPEHDEPLFNFHDIIMMVRKETPRSSERNLLVPEFGEHGRIELKGVKGKVSLTMVWQALDDWERFEIDGIQFTNEGGVYHLFTLIETPVAAKFRKWLFHDVVPALRRGNVPMTMAELSIAAIHKLSGAMMERQQEIRELRSETERALLEHEKEFVVVRGRVESTEQKINEVEHNFDVKLTEVVTQIIGDSHTTSAAFLTAIKDKYGLEANDFGAFASREAKRRGVKLGKAAHATWGQVNRYPVWFLEEMYQLYLTTVLKAPQGK